MKEGKRRVGKGQRRGRDSLKHDVMIPFATREPQLKNLAFLSYWYRKKRLQMHF